MKALSIRQPWCFAILHAGKSIENRTWRTDYRGPLLIHAGRTLDTRRGDWPWPEDAPQPPEGLPLGSLVGIVELVDVVHISTVTNPWACGPWCWVLRDPRAFAEPIPWTGRLGLFEVDDRVIQAALGL